MTTEEINAVLDALVEWEGEDLDIRRADRSLVRSARNKIGRAVVGLSSTPEERLGGLTREETARVLRLVQGRAEEDGDYPPDYGSPVARLDDGIATKLSDRLDSTQETRE